MAKMFALTVFEIIILFFVLKSLVSIISTIVIFVVPLVKGTTLESISNDFKRSSAFKRIGVSFLLNGIELQILTVMSIICLSVYFLVHAHYTNISLVVTSLIIAAIDAQLYFTIKTEKVLTGSQII